MQTKERFIPYKIENRWLIYIYDTTTGTLIRQFKGRGRKEQCIENCKLRNKVLLNK